MTESDRPNILVLPPLVALGAAVLAIVLEWLAPLGWLPPRGSALVAIGVVILVVGVLIAVSGMRAFKQAGTNIDPRQPALKIVRDGPYRFTRNPMYLGLVLLQPGLALAFSLDWALLLTPIVWAILHWGVVLREEAYLEEKFGDPYRDLLASTRRWL